MNVGTIFLIFAVILFFLAAVGSALLPNPTAWGLVCFVLGHLLGGVALPAKAAQVGTVGVAMVLAGGLLLYWVYAGRGTVKKQMGQRHVVAISLLYVGFLVVTSGGWIKDARNYVQQVTGGNAAQQPPLTDEMKQTIFKFVGGYAALWLILTAGTESDTTADAAGALAVAIALGASYLYLPKVIDNLGLTGASSGGYKGDTTGQAHGHQQNDAHGGTDMVTKELFGAIAGVLVLAGIAYALYRGDASVKVLGAAGDALAGSIVAATPRG